MITAAEPNPSSSSVLFFTLLGMAAASLTASFSLLVAAVLIH
jgi:hypothetical protein